MKIAFIVNEFPVLSETFILSQITGLLDRGHEVDIYAHRPRNDPVVHKDVEKYNLLNRLYSMRVPIPKNKIYRLIKGISLIAIDLQKNPIAVLNALNPLKFGKDAVSLRTLYQIGPFLDKGPYDIVHSHFGPNGNLAITLKDIGVIHGEVVTTFYGYDISSYVQKNGKNIYDTLFKKGDLFLCVSEEMKETLLKLGCGERKIIVHRLGVQFRNYHYYLHMPKVNGKLQLLTIARLVEKKGVQYGIQSVAKLLKKYPHIEYKIAGDGYLKNALQALIEDLGICCNVKLLGWQRQDQIVELLRESNILLAPSMTSSSGDREGIPVAIVEALACGLPVISTRHSGIPEIIHDGETGLLVPECNADVLAEKLEHLIEHSELWTEMGRKGREYIEEHYDIDRLNDRLVEIYQQLLTRC
jgi:colanic acid/amylovoran/stewartan biosynthesis glycosyltransferase WcaL/AmsK/CpsK